VAHGCAFAFGPAMLLNSRLVVRDNPSNPPCHGCVAGVGQCPQADAFFDRGGRSARWPTAGLRRAGPKRGPQFLQPRSSPRRLDPDRAGDNRAPSPTGTPRAVALRKSTETMDFTWLSRKVRQVWEGCPV
jgi:hypothetical protein